MRTKYIKFLAIILVLFSCEKENKTKTDDGLIVEIMHKPYTRTVHSNTNNTLNISDSVYIFQELTASYYCYQPTSNQNIFTVQLIDKLDNDSVNGFKKHISIDLFTPLVKPEDFFQKNTIIIDSIMIYHSGVRENFFHAKAKLTWDTASYENFSFKGRGSFELIDTLNSIDEPSKYYPNQRIDFEFK